MLAGMRDEICPLAAQEEPSETVDRSPSVPTTELWARPVTADLYGCLGRALYRAAGADEAVMCGPL